MKKKILPLIFILVVCLSLMRPFCVSAVPVEPEQPASLTLHYQKEVAAFPGLDIGIYRVAEAFPDGSFQLIAPFDSYPVDIHGITTQQQWQTIAQTRWSYMVADQIAPDKQAQTDESGKVTFSDLQTGLYFVREAVAEDTAGTYIFNQFMVYLPTPQPDGTHHYDVQAKPKCTSFVPKTEYTVTKLWKDSGEQKYRPKEIIVDIYNDGVLLDTQTLSPSNNWTYTWVVSGEDYGKWTVAERTVPEQYKVKIQQSGSHFSIINTRKTTTDVPKTGDSHTLLPWIMLLSISGIALLLLGFHRRRQG